MAGHSKWANIKHRKAAQDKKRGNVYAKHGKLITVAARLGGGDPDMNPSLKVAIQKAKADNVTNDIIDKAIKKGTGGDKDAVAIEEIFYEGYGPGGIAIIVKSLTDNKNRAVSSIRHIFSKSGGNLGTSGSVSFMFDYKGIFQVETQGKNSDELQLTLMDLGVLDIEEDEGKLTCTTEAGDLMKIYKDLDSKGIKALDPTLAYIPKDYVKVDDDIKNKLEKIIETLEEDDDVEEVFTNAEF